MKKIGIASDHGGYELKVFLSEKLKNEGFEVIDFGNKSYDPDDDYPDYVTPLAESLIKGELFRGLAVCGSGVGACIVANKFKGIRACLINDTFSAHQGVEDDDMNLICLGGWITGKALAWEITTSFLSAGFSEKERHKRRLVKIEELEKASDSRQ